MKGGFYMQFQTIQLINNVDNEIVQDLQLHSGVNLVVDDLTTDENNGNKVGKTTFLRLIDILMGSSKKNLLYKDEDTGAIEEQLKQLITNKRFSVKAILSEITVQSPRTLSIEVELFPRGKYKFNNEPVSQAIYKEKLKNALFSLTSDKPTFRELISAFVRVHLNGDSDRFLKFLPRTDNDTYRSVYNFLFNLSASASDAEISALKKNYKKLKDARSEYRRVQGLSDDTITGPLQVISSLQYELTQLSAQLENIVSAKTFKENENQIQEVRKRYANLTSKIASQEFKYSRTQSNLDELESSAGENLSIDSDLTRKFFDEITDIIPSVTKTFDELVDFNQKIKSNRKKWLQSVMESQSAKIESLKEQRHQLVGDNDLLISLVENDKFDEYENLLSEISRYQILIAEKQEQVNTLQSFDQELDKIQRRLSELSRNPNNESTDLNLKYKPAYVTRMDSFNSFFTKYAQTLNGDQPVLTYVPQNASDYVRATPFPLQIQNLSKISTGTKKALVAAYDLAYQAFAKQEGKVVPNFIVHDVMENIDGSTLTNIIDLADEVGTQFIFAVLSEKLKGTNISETTIENKKIIRLSDKTRLFGD